MKALKAAAAFTLGVLMEFAVLLSETGDSRICAEEQDAFVAISIERVVADESGGFTAAVSLDELPETGISAVEFAISYDPAVLSISDVELQYDTGADDAEAAANPELAGTVFTYEDKEGRLKVRWATALLEDDYWLRECCVFFTVSGQLHENVQPGGGCMLHIVPYAEEEGSGTAENAVTAGYLDSEGKPYQYQSKATDGAVWKPLNQAGATKYGDLDLDGQLRTDDAVLLQRLIAEEIVEIPLSAAAYANADCKPDGTLSVSDVTLILRALKYPGSTSLGAD